MSRLTSAQTTAGLSLFRYVLGSRFDDLAPALRRHYDLPPGHSVIVEGLMDAWNRLPWARPFAPFMPVPGQGQRVRVRNRGLLDEAGRPCYEWVREFHTASGLAGSYTLTRPTPRTMPFPAVLDCFNQPSTIGLTLHVEIADSGRALVMHTRGPQYLILGKRLAPLARPLRVDTVAIERVVADDAQRIATVVIVSHAVLGKLFGYQGVLTVREPDEVGGQTV
ncbi:MAG: DUF4166 domain-containing protein [Anaerolineae bacterium]|nr:DUF4166 domain-containing protein [Thermoflexales bacterium]MDW8407105.1 DUF4166 domain-containing protein [Anaerolineae bacterium]